MTAADSTNTQRPSHGSRSLSATPAPPNLLPVLGAPDRPLRSLYGTHSLSDAEAPTAQPVERRGVLVCHRLDGRGNPIAPEWSYWRDLSEARQARAELPPCGPRCGGIHTCVEVAVPQYLSKDPA
jgi:hypothetical protein